MATTKLIGIGKVPLSDEQRKSLIGMAKAQHCEMIDLLTVGMDRLSECDALIGHFEFDELKAAKNMQWLQVAPAGVERYMAEGVLPESVTLCNGSGAYGTAIAEYMIGGLLMIQRRMVNYLDNQRAHKWLQFPGITTLYGSRIAVIGAGDLGTSFASRCHAMGAKVVGVRRSSGAHADCYEKMFLTDQIDQAIADADVVALCLPSTSGTVGLFTKARIEKMKPGAILINVGRGTAVDTMALIDALKSGHLGGALLDVTDPEPLPEDHPLWDAPGAVVTPHISGIDRDRLSASFVFEIFKDNLTNYLTGAPLNNIVDRQRGY